MPDAIGGKRLVGELGGLFGDIKKALDDAKQGIAGAASELMEEVRDLKHVEGEIRQHTAAVRQFKTGILGNATGGENMDEPPVTGEKG